MFAVFWESIKNAWELGEITCKKCGYKSNGIIKMAYHLKRYHAIGYWQNRKAILKYNLITRFFQIALSSVLCLILLIIKLICLPFYYLYEII